MVIFIGIFPHPRPLSQRERGERKYGEIGNKQNHPQPLLGKEGSKQAPPNSQGIFPALARRG